MALSTEAHVQPVSPRDHISMSTGFQGAADQCNYSICQFSALQPCPAISSNGCLAITSREEVSSSCQRHEPLSALWSWKEKVPMRCIWPEDVTDIKTLEQKDQNLRESNPIPSCCGRGTDNKVISLTHKCDNVIPIHCRITVITNNNGIIFHIMQPAIKCKLGHYFAYN
jgi:hypothetical protein